jgi:hypothetical protein
MTDGLMPPITTGITGKRNLLGKDAAVAAALKGCFDLLDEQFPHSRKTLLTGLAVGADTVAADLALARGWKVVAVLPFALDLYRQDFDDPADAAKLVAYADPAKGVLRDPEKGRVIELAPLCERDTARPYGASELTRTGNASNAVRTDHYEQVGLFIAERCALLIGVMPAAEKPDRVGGTARIVEYQLRGAFDATSERINEQSQILLPPVHLDAPRRGPVWLVDLDTVGNGGAGGADALGAVQLWHAVLRRGGAAVDETEIEIEKLTWRSPAELTEALRLAARIEDFNARAEKFDAARREREVKARARQDEQWRGDLPDPAQAGGAGGGGAGAGGEKGSGSAAAMIEQIRSSLSAIQGRAKLNLARSMKRLAWFFLLAIVALEVVHLDFQVLPDIPFDWSALYVVFSLLIIGTVLAARMRKLPQYTEDYRAVAEALRVQLVWWDAGFTRREHRVDLAYLCGTTGSLGQVRQAVGYLIGAALAEHPAPQPSPKRVASWIAGQIKFFTARTKQRQALLSLIEDGIWFAFVGSIGMGLWLLVLNDRLTMRLVDGLWRGEGFLPWLMPWIALILTLTFGWLVRLTSAHRSRGLWSDAAKFAMGLLAGIAFAAFVYALLRSPYDLAGALGRNVMEVSGCANPPDRIPGEPSFELCAHRVSYKLISALMVIVAAIAGAFRFYTERMALEAELHSYREALATFQRADEELKRLAREGSERAAQRRQEILLALGKTALKENESWIRAHRVQPLEPHL